MKLIVSGLVVALVAGPLALSADARTACAPRVTGLRLPSDFHAGETAQATVTLSCASGRAVTVRLHDDHDDVTVPDRVRVPAGERSRSFRVTAGTDQLPSYAVRVSARRGTTRPVRERMRVTPGLERVNFAESSQPNDFALEVRFTGPLPRGGATLALSSDNDAVGLPATWENREGATRAEIYDYWLAPVTEDVPVTLAVTYGRRTLTVTKTLLAPADPIHPTGTLRRQGEGDAVYGAMWREPYDLRLDAPAPEGGLPVAYRVRGDHPAVALDSSWGTISAGAVTDQVKLDFRDVSSTQHVVLEAQIGETILELPITIHPRVTQIVLPGTVAGGHSFTGTVLTAGAAEEDTVVWLGANRGGIQLPASVTVPAGATTATFQGRASRVDTPTDYRVAGSYGGPRASSNTMTVTP